MSFTSSLDNIAIGSEEREKVHLSCFSKEMGSNVDLVQVCQEQEEDKHEVKLEFKIEENDVEKSEKQKKENDGGGPSKNQSKKSWRKDCAPRRRPWRAGLEFRDYKLRKTTRKTKKSQRKKWRRKSLRK